MAAETANATTLNPNKGVKVEMSIYDPITKEVVKQINSVNFGITPLQQGSTPIVIKMNVIGVKKISNIKLAIVKCSETVSGIGTQNSDGSFPEGNFGIEHSSALEEKNSLSSFFGSTNTLTSPVYEDNVLINNTTNTESEFVYLNIKTPNLIKRGFVYYKWFFDFS